MEDHRINGDYLQVEEKEKVNNILNRIVKDGRIRATDNGKLESNKVDRVSGTKVAEASIWL